MQATFLPSLYTTLSSFRGHAATQALTVPVTVSIEWSEDGTIAHAKLTAGEPEYCDKARFKEGQNGTPFFPALTVDERFAALRGTGRKVGESATTNTPGNQGNDEAS
jgi:hypothetical protein